MRVAFGNDHAASAELRTELIGYIEGLGHEVLDMGSDTEERVDYPDFACKVCTAVVGGEADCGILVCGTGVGMSIAANKIRGIRAANVTLPAVAPLVREHNDANVLTLSSRFVNTEENKQIIKVFLETDFAGGRHAQRVAKMMDFEERR
ncbi:MAG: ribose 5-phosphate isomerase B [Coriobacteriales bacterium]